MLKITDTDNSCSFQKGSSLIEILVSLMILSVGILGVMGLQTRSMQFNQGALHLVRATILAEDYVDRMRSNIDFAGLYTIGSTDAARSYINCEDADANCTPRDLASYHVGTWQEEVSELLPGATVEVANIPPDSEYTITINYRDDRLEASSSYDQDDSLTKSVSFRTVL